jgi:serine/threonine-protein kinase
MKTNAACPLEEVASCRNVPEHHEPVESSGAPFQPGHVLDGRFLITEVLSRSGMATIFKAEDRQNVMICRDGTIRIMDFGIARDAASRRITRVGNANSMGTPDYMAPEQVTGKRADKRTDIYGLGALLYEMLTGALPFPDENPWAALNARVTGDPVAPRKLNPDLSAQAEEIVLRALQRDPADRYPNAAAMKAELDDAEHVRVTGLADKLQQPAAWKPGLSQRPGVLAAVLLGPILIAIAALVFLLVRR